MPKRKAPKGKFRVIGFDSFSREFWHDGDFSKKNRAIECAKKKAGQMTLMYVHDDSGEIVFQAGNY